MGQWNEQRWTVRYGCERERNLGTGPTGTRTPRDIAVSRVRHLRGTESMVYGMHHLFAATLKNSRLDCRLDCIFRLGLVSGGPCSCDIRATTQKSVHVGLRQLGIDMQWPSVQACVNR